MNSMIEYIRQLNQSSVTMQDEWLTRLRNVEAGPDTALPLPEIVLTRDSSIRSFDEQQYQAPVTIVKTRELRQQREAAPHTSVSPQIRQPAAEQEIPVTTPDGESARPAVPVTTNFQTQVETASLTESAGSGVCQVVAPGVTPIPETADSDNTVQGEPPLPAPPVDRRQVANSRSQPTSDATAAPKTQPAKTQPAEKQPLASTRELLETADIEGDILRPTIMPLRREAGRDVFDTEAATPDVVSPSTPPQSSIKEVIRGLESQAGEASYNAAAVEDTTDTQETCLNVSDLSSESQIMASLPTDKLGQRFCYSQSRKQQLIDAVVDQITERFPVATTATVMLIGASREIDVDSASCRVATCLANRDIGNILLVDGNLHVRQLTSVLGLDQQPGVGELTNESDLDGLLCGTDNPRLKILPAGMNPENAQDLLQANLINKSCKLGFDYTIIAGGRAGDPLTDSWAAVVDGVYLLVDVDESDRDGSQEVVNHFRSMGTRIVGCIATRS